LCNIGLKDYNNAGLFFKRVIDSDKSDYYAGLAHYWLGMILTEQKMYLEALDEFNSLIIKYPNNPMYIYSYKRILEINVELKKWDKVIDLCNTMISMKHANLDGSIYYYMALANENNNNIETALKYYRLIIESNAFDSKYVIEARKRVYAYSAGTSS